MLSLFAILLIGFLITDLFIVPKLHHVPHIHYYVCIATIIMAILYGFNIYALAGWERTAEYYAAYVIEYTLSLDNVFVFYMIFKKMKLPRQAQRHVLSWGVWSAVIMRGFFIYTGLTLLHKFHWLTYVFGAFLLYAAFHMLLSHNKPAETETKFIQYLKKHLRVTPKYEGLKFFIRKHRKVYATPLFITLCAIEFADLLFAIDSVPAVLAISQDLHVVYASNIFAILGLRALYFVVEDTVSKFDKLIYALVIILIFIGIKMLLSYWISIPILFTLFFIAITLISGIIASRHAKSKR